MTSTEGGVDSSRGPQEGGSSEKPEREGHTLPSHDGDAMTPLAAAATQEEVPSSSSSSAAATDAAGAVREGPPSEPAPASGDGHSGTNDVGATTTPTAPPPTTESGKPVPPMVTASPDPPTPTEQEHEPAQDPEQERKVKIHLVAVGSAPILKKAKFQIAAHQTFASLGAIVSRLVRKPSVFLYCNSAFVPSPEASLGDLHDCFQIRDELVVHYSLQEAWG